MSNVINWSIIMTVPIMVASSSNWMSIWLFIEIGTMAFIQIAKSTKSAENIMIYFLNQTMASMILLMGIMIMNMKNNQIVSKVMMSSDQIIMMAMIFKLGIPPCHNWFIKVGKILKWAPFMALMTIQKLPPLLIIQTIGMKNSSVMICMVSAMVGVAAQFLTSMMKDILLYSSINHTGWMLMLSSIQWKSLMVYMMVYTGINVSIISMMKKFNIKSLQDQTNMKSNINLTMGLMSMAGIPPLAGFAMKWVFISSSSSIPGSNTLLIMLMTTSVANAFIYTRFVMNSSLKAPAGASMNQKYKNPIIMYTFQMATMPMVLMIN